MIPPVPHSSPEPLSPPGDMSPAPIEIGSAQDSSSPNTALSNSPFAAMFRGGATVEELQQFINGCLKMISREIKRTQERWEKSQRRMRQMMEGKIPDEW